MKLICTRSFEYNDLWLVLLKAVKKIKHSVILLKKIEGEKMCETFIVKTLQPG